MSERQPGTRSILVFALGSGGDVHPSLAVSKALRARGHSVAVYANPYYEKAVRGAGLDFRAMGSQEGYLDAMRDPKLWKQRGGWSVLIDHMLGSMEPLYETIKQAYRPGETLVIAPFSAFGARIANEKLGVPLVNLLLEPLLLRSLDHQPGRIVDPRHLPLVRAYRRAMLWALDRFVLDRMLGEKTNAFRATLGLPPVSRFAGGWFHSPDLVVGLFPNWYAKPMRDWPPQVRLTGFPLFDEDEAAAPVPPAVEEFLAEGEPPIVFTLGTPMRTGKEFFHTSAEACRILGRRGILLSPFAEQMPSDLPAGVKHFDYVPFGSLLPRAAALVHHGGVGTIAQALRAGIPQIVHPLNFAHPDNAIRMVALGVGEMLRGKQYTAPKAAERLDSLLSSPEVARRLELHAAKFQNQSWLEETCRLIEAVPLRR
ncbi:MAG: glycosyltransferase [Acidobacteria bacterium]|nr:glycosyltransferase [Acidobacteriota bacterium]